MRLHLRQKAQDAIGQKKFKDEIIKIQINNKENVIFNNDEHPRNNLIIDESSWEKLIVL